MKRGLVKWQNSKKSMTQFFTAGDEVCKDIWDYVLEVMPPVYYTDKLVQMGEPYNFRKTDGKPTYITIEKDSGKYYYRGNCPVGERKMYEVIGSYTICNTASILVYEVTDEYVIWNYSDEDKYRKTAIWWSNGRAWFKASHRVYLDNVMRIGGYMK